MSNSLEYSLLFLTFIVFGTGAWSQICGNVCSCVATANRTLMDCSHRKLTVVPEVDDWPALTQELDVSSNKIESLEVGLQHAHLKVLKCARNMIQKIAPAVFSGLTSLQLLDLSNNVIAEITGDTFRGLSGLVTLNLSHNKLKSIDDFTFSGLSLIQELSLSDNKIVHLQNSNWNRMYEIKKIYISGIGAYTLDANLFHGLEKLEDVDLSYNDFAQVPTLALRSAKNLKRLKLDANPIEKLDKSSFLRLTSLTELELSFMTKLSDVEFETFSDLRNLSTLELSSNRNLRSISADAFKGLFGEEIKLKEINLQLNKLTTLSALPCARLRKMNLQSNPWKCDCRMRWIKKCILSENYASDLKCDLPVKGKLIVEADESVFSCDFHQSQALEDAHANKVVQAASLALGCLLLLLLAVLIASVLKWRNIRTWWHNRKRGPGAVYYVRARTNPLEQP